MKIADELGIQSYCFRGFKNNADVARMLKECGSTKIELCGAHADFTKEETFDEIISQYKEAGVDIISIGVQPFKNNEAVETLYFEFAKRAGAKQISADFAIDTAPASYRTAEKLADKYDINLAIHNHGGRHWLGCAEILGHTLANTSERIGLCLDTAWALDSGEDPVAMVEKFEKRLYGIHFKDFVFDSARKRKDVVIGTGNIDLARLLSALKSINFNGMSAIEYEADINDPVPALTKCVDAVRKSAAAL